MSQTLFTNLSSYFNNMDPEDPVYQKELIRPAEIKEDVKLMEQRKRVTNVMRSKHFKKDLENIFLKYNDDENVETSTSSLFLAEISEQLLLTAIPKNKISNYNQLGSKKGVICINDINTAGNVIYGTTERQGRCKLASIFRLLDMFGWNSNFNSVMTTRPYVDRDQFLINPFGLMFHEVTASSLITVDFKGSILDCGSTVLEVNPLAWMIHSAVYSCRNSIRAILELKTSEALAISSLEKGLLPICREAIVLGPIGIINKLPGLINETKSTSLIRADLNNYLTSIMVPNLKILIVPNCGILICGDTVEEAWHLLMNCQIACETQIKLGNLEIDDLYIPDINIQTNLYNQWRSTDLGGIKKIDSQNKNSEQDHPVHWRLGELEFEALMRHMDNNGYRTGYFYRQENIFQPEQSAKSSTDKVKYEVEIPPTSISTIEQKNPSLELEDENKFTNKSFNRAKSEKWFNTPNLYKLVEDNKTTDNNLSYNFSSGQSERKSTKWESAKSPNFSAPIPQHPVTAGAYVAIGHNIKPNSNKDKIQSRINPKELIENQKRVKNKYYQDTNTAGPMSCLLESGLSREEARMLKQESLKKHIGPGSASPNDQVVTSASKGIIQRGHKAIVYKDLYKTANPFDVTEDELANYHKEVDRKLNPDKYKDVEVENENTCKEETPEIKITFSQNESTVPPEENDAGDTSLTRRDTDTSNRNGLIEKNVSVPNESFVCDPFFQSDFDEDFNNLKLTDSGCASSPKKPNSDDDIISPSLAPPPKHVSGDSAKRNTSEGLTKSASMKSDKKKNFGSFSFKILGRSKSLKASAADVLENKAATLAAPGYGTITSETSGVDISNDEIDKDAKSKKKKRKFKLPSFSKKKKDKSK